MKQDYPQKGIGSLCGLFGKTRHAYYDYKWRKLDFELKDEIVLQLAAQIRQSLPRLGTRKMLHLLTPMLAEHQLDIGRDALFDLLERHHLLVRNRRRQAITTDSRHWMRKYSNLIKELQVNKADQLWVSDITYIRLPQQFAYLSLVTDAYSRKIVGFSLRRDLSAEGCLQALAQALKQRQTLPWPLIHHSDRGSQYCCKAYVDLLTDNEIAISMTENGDPYENALAERVNGILKSEFKLYSSTLSFEQTQALVQQSITAYNEIRPHASCNYLTPQQAHWGEGVLKKRWKKYARKLPQKKKQTADQNLDTFTPV